MARDRGGGEPQLCLEIRLLRCPAPAPPRPSLGLFGLLSPCCPGSGAQASRFQHVLCFQAEVLEEQRTEPNSCSLPPNMAGRKGGGAVARPRLAEGVTGGDVGGLREAPLARGG